MTSEICAKCGYEESEHYHLTDGVYCPRYVKELGLPCEKFEPQNHNPPENTSDLVEASKCSEDTGPDASKSSGSGKTITSVETYDEDYIKNSIKDGSGSLSDKRKKLLKTLQELQPELTMTWSMVFRDIVNQDKEFVKKLRNLLGPVWDDDLKEIFGEALV